MKEKNKGVLLDLDGVLLDTEGMYTQFWDAVDARFPSGIANFSQVIKGCNLHDILGNYPTEQMRRDVVAMLDEFQRDMVYRFFDGALESLAQMRAAGLKTCIVTSSDQRKMDAVYAQHPAFRAMVDDVVTGEMVTHAKPHPECYLLGASRLGLEIAQCVVVEDSINGLRAGRAAGARVLGLATTVEASRVEPLCDLMLDGIDQVTIEMLLSL